MSDEAAERFRAGAIAALELLRVDPVQAVRNVAKDLDQAALPAADMDELVEEFSAVCGHAHGSGV